MKNFENITKNALDEWIFFLKNNQIKDNFKAKGLKKAKQELDILKLPERERMAYGRYQDDLHYQASMVESTFTTGMIQGEEAGLAKGKKKKSVEVATNLISRGGMDTKTIAGITGLTEEEIKKLKPE